MTTMKAMRIHQYGGPEVLIYEDAPKPQITPQDVLVRVHAAGVNQADWKIRKGLFQDFAHYTFPFIPGWDFSGVVEAVGDEVAGVSLGQEVYANSDAMRDGAYASYIAVRASEVAPKPRTLDHNHAAALPLAALAAWQSLFVAAGLQTGHRVLIHGAAGGVGLLAVQLAKWKGAYVIGTASGDDLTLLRDLDVDQVIDYHSTRFEDVVHGVDVVFDVIGGDTQERSWQTLKREGMLVSIASTPSVERARAAGVRSLFVSTLPNGEQLKRVAELVDTGKIKVFLGTVLPLTDARHAHELSEFGHVRGKIVLRVA